MDKKKIKKIAINIIKYTLLIVVFVYIGKYFYANINDLKSYKFNINIPVFLLSLLCFMIYKLYNAILWHYITVKNKCSISLEKAIVSWNYSMLGKYIPGKVFYLGGRLYFYQKEKQSIKNVTFCFFLENICTLLAASFIFILSFIFSDMKMFNQYKPAAVLVVIVFFIAINPKILEFAVNFPLKLFKKNPLKILINYKEMLIIILLFISNWLVLGLGFHWLVSSIYPVKLSDYFFLSGSFAVSSMIGILVLFAPSGIGVRETALVFALKAIMPEPTAFIIAVVSRIWVTIGELGTILLAFIYAKIKGLYNDKT